MKVRRTGGEVTRGRLTHRQTNTRSHKTDRQTNTQAVSQANKQAMKKKQRQVDKQTDEQTNRQASSQSVSSQSVSQTNIPTDRQTDKRTKGQNTHADKRTDKATRQRTTKQTKRTNAHQQKTDGCGSTVRQMKRDTCLFVVVDGPARPDELVNNPSQGRLLLAALKYVEKQMCHHPAPGFREKTPDEKKAGGGEGKAGRGGWGGVHAQGFRGVGGGGKGEDGNHQDCITVCRPYDEGCVGHYASTYSLGVLIISLVEVAPHLDQVVPHIRATYIFRFICTTSTGHACVSTSVIFPSSYEILRCALSSFPWLEQLYT